jgi:TonB-linked SusC/RagA family outer membrane protein
MVLLLGLLSLTGSAFAQGTLKGKVTDKTTGEALPTANVFLQEIRRGATTDFDGNYVVTGVPAGTYNLRVTYVGYKQFNTVVDVSGSEVVFNIQLEADLVGLEELVVTGYGSQIKEKQTGNVARVTSEALTNIPVPTFEQALQGRMAGVSITAGNGKLGQGLQIRVRGSSSISASNEPLYVIDGIPVISQGNALGSNTNPLADINFNDIESINVLKDASASAIYGSRASNGVVVITTKKGKSGKSTFNVNYSQGASAPTNYRGFLNAEQYAKGFHQAAKNSDDLYGIPYDDPDSFTEYFNFVMDAVLVGNTDWRANLTANPRDSARAGGFKLTDTNWEKLAFQDAPQRNLDISASGGNDKTSFFASGSITDQKGIIIENRLTRFSGRLNVEHQVNSDLKIGVNMTASRLENIRLSNDNAFSTPMQLVAQVPNTLAYDTAGARLPNGHPNSSLPGTLYYNGLLDIKGSDRVNQVYRTLGSSYLSYNILPNLTFRGEFGADIRTQNEDYWFGASTAENTGLRFGGGQSRWVQQVSYNSKAFLNYQAQFNKVHNLNAIVGTEFNQTETRTTNAVAQDFPLDNFRTIATAAVASGVPSATLTMYNFLSQFARAEYDYKDKYLLSVSGRVDGSSRFGAKNRFGFFPSASVGWIVTKENFLANNQALTFLKMRASWGKTGNAEIGNFSSLNLYGATAYAGIPGITQAQLGDPNLKWETTTQRNLGLDFGLLKDRITGEFDWYNKNTEDLLLTVNVPATSGYLSVLKNVGTLENKGWEMVINTWNLTGAFSWKTTFNIGRNQNKITNIQGQILNGGFVNQAREGYPIGSFYTVEFAGANPDNGDAIWYVNAEDESSAAFQALVANGSVFQYKGRYVTANYALANRKVVGNPNPLYQGGITNTFSYKGFDLSVLFQFVRDFDIYNGGGVYMSANYEWLDNQTLDQQNAWTPSNTNTMVPQARFADAPNGSQRSSRYLEDGSFWRLKTLSLGYNISRKWTQRLGVNSLRVYATGQNLITWTKYSGWDPEVNTDFLAGNIGLGNDFYSAPQARTWLAGINVGF